MSKLSSTNKILLEKLDASQKLNELFNLRKFLKTDKNEVIELFRVLEMEEEYEETMQRIYEATENELGKLQDKVQICLKLIEPSKLAHG